MKSRRILLILTGGIACYKALNLIRLLKKRGDDVQVIMTRGAQKFITPVTVSALTGTETLCDLLTTQEAQDMRHIQASRSADLIVVALSLIHI